MEYTKGPWEFWESSDTSNTKFNIAGPSGIYKERPDVALAMTEGDARLIAAAPEMLEALKIIVLAEFGSLDHPQIKCAGMWHKAVAAIKKAEGR